MKAAEVFEYIAFADTILTNAYHVAARGGKKRPLAAGAKTPLPPELRHNGTRLAYYEVAVVQKPAAAVRHRGGAGKAAFHKTVDRVDLPAALPQQSSELA